MNQLSLNVGQSLAALAVLFALGRGVSDATLAQAPERAHQRDLMEASKLEGKLAAMRRSPDKVLRHELVSKIAALYADAGMYSKAEPFVLVSLASARDAGGVAYAAALMEANAFYQNCHDLAKASYLSAAAVKILEANNDQDALCQAYLTLASEARGRAEISGKEKEREDNFIASEQWLAKAVDIARKQALRAETLNLLRNTMLLISVAEGRNDEMVLGLEAR